MALINVGGAATTRRPEEDPLAAMFQSLPQTAKLPQQPGPQTPQMPSLQPLKSPYETMAMPGSTASMAPEQTPTEQPTQPRVPGPSPTASATGAPPFSYDQINALYQQFLGRTAGQDEYQGWATGAFGPPELGSITQQIQNSEEAGRYRAAHGGGGTTGGSTGAPAPSQSGDPGGYLLQLLQSGMDRDQAIAQTSQAFSLQPGQDGYPLYYPGNNTIGLKGSYLANVGGRWNQVTRNPNEGLSQGGGGGGGGYSGTNIFNDPATAQFEQLLNSMISRFNTPQTPPHYQQAIDQLNAYLAQLNGPVYTPAQMELMQTQAWDPMQQQHDAARQQLIQRLGSQGISPSSGIFEKALEDLDRQFQQAHTTTQAGFANQAIGLQRQNQVTAASLAPQISNFEQAQTSWQDTRALQAEMLAALIPQMASQRLRDASGSIQGLNPMSLLEMQNRFQNQGYGQGADYGSAIMQLLAQLFGLGGQ